VKVAISTDNHQVSAHFGRCPEFTILEITDGKIVNQQTIPNPGHQPGFLPAYFEQMGVNMIIAGGGGQRAQALFAEKNIDFLLGVTGSIATVIKKLCDGELEGGASLCQGGGHDHGDGDHPCQHHEEN
jgi:predicted Fe-Mo cluster-binding NifX family protein